MQNLTEFYPTPSELVEKMLDSLDLPKVHTVLEPSAGKGDIVEGIQAYYEKHKYDSRDSYRRYFHDQFDIDTVEIDSDMRHILRGKEYRVIHDDFLTLQTYKRYDLILMNPPFSEGVKHLLKALDMQSSGGQIVCLLNAETIRNPYTVQRQDLVRRLEDIRANIEYIEGAFASAEVPTDVEIALIKVNVPSSEDTESIILDNLRREESYDYTGKKPDDIVSGDFFERIIARYNFEIRAGLTLIREYDAMKPLIMDSMQSEYKKPVLKLEIDDNKYYGNMVNVYVEKIRYKYWNALFVSPEFSKAMTAKMSEEFSRRLNDLKHYDFSWYNIWQIREDLNRHLLKSVEDSIVEMFDEFSHKHYWDETSKNIHYYNGWKTNKAWIVNKKVILPCMNAWSSYSDRLDYSYQLIQKLADIEKAFNYLNGSAMNQSYLGSILKQAERMGQSKKIHLKYFDVTFYKKGTCHIEFSDLELLKKFNLFGSQKKNWLPPSYGKVRYEDMSQEEQDVIDSFEGRTEYEKVMMNKEFYLFQSSDLLMLDAS